MKAIDWHARKSSILKAIKDHIIAEKAGLIAAIEASGITYVDFNRLVPKTTRDELKALTKKTFTPVASKMFLQIDNREPEILLDPKVRGQQIKLQLYSILQKIDDESFYPELTHKLSSLVDRGLIDLSTKGKLNYLFVGIKLAVQNDNLPISNHPEAS